MILIFVQDIPKVDEIMTTNRLKKQAVKAYTQNNYMEAADKLRILTDSMKVQEGEVMLNLAHAYFRMDSTDLAMQRYKQVTAANVLPSHKSLAYQNMAVIQARDQKLKTALSYLKQALREDYTNQDARYNYELVKQLLDKQKEQEQKDKDDKPEPSEFAKKLKEKAEQLASEGEFAKAFQLMQMGKQKDFTVSVYDDFIQRLGKVANIDEKY